MSREPEILKATAGRLIGPSQNTALAFLGTPSQHYELIPSYGTEVVRRGELTVSTRRTGPLLAKRLWTVGAQLQVEAAGNSSCDYTRHFLIILISDNLFHECMFYTHHKSTAGSFPGDVKEKINKLFLSLLGPDLLKVSMFGL